MDVPTTVEKTIDDNTTFQEDQPFIIQLTEASIINDEPSPLNDVNGELVEYVDDEAEISDDPLLESELEDEDMEVNDSDCEK